MARITELAKAVEAMRQAQNDYFKFRTQVALHDSKKKEKEVDKLIQEILTQNNQKQSSLI